MRLQQKRVKEAEVQISQAKIQYSLEERTILNNTMKIVHKSLHNAVPDYLQGLFTSVSDKCGRELRNSKLDLKLLLLKTSLGQKSF